MIYLLALIGLVTLAVLLWKAFGPRFDNTRNVRVSAPDDDPEFLWNLGRQTRRTRTDDTDPGSPDQ